MRSDDITDLLTAQPTGPSQPVGYRQGTIMEWNPITLENRVLVDHVPMRNLAVLGAAEAASYRPGVAVGIHTAGSSWAIIGRFVVPNTADATDAITQIGQRAFTATVLTQEQTNSATFTDLATVGPRVSNLRIPASGKARVTISAQFDAVAAALTAGSVGVEVSGDASIAANSHQSLLLVATSGGINATRVVLFDGLPAGGLCTFTLKYRGNGVDAVQFADRDITVETL